MWLQEFGNVQELVLYVFAAIAALNVVLALAILIVGCCFRSSTPGSSLDTNIVLGGLTLVGTILLRGIQVSWTTNKILETICEFHPALLTVGLLWFIGGLLMKVSAIFHYYHRNSGTSVSHYECLPHLWLLFIMIIDVAIVLVWTFKFRPILYVPASGDLNVRECAGPQDPIMYMIVSVFHGILLLFAAIIIWPAVHLARDTPTSYESTLMSVIIYNTMFVTVAATLIFLFGDLKFDKNMQYAIIGGLMNYAIFTAFLLLLIGKVVTARKEQSSGYD